MLDGDRIWFTAVGGMTQISNAGFTVTVVDSTNITIGVDSTGYTTYTSGGAGTVMGVHRGATT
jgi:hypothetical protein